VTFKPEQMEALTGLNSSFLTITNKLNKKRIFIVLGLAISWKTIDPMILIFTKWDGSSSMRMTLRGLFKVRAKKKEQKLVQTSQRKNLTKNNF